MRHFLPQQNQCWRPYHRGITLVSCELREHNVRLLHVPQQLLKSYLNQLKCYVSLSHDISSFSRPMMKQRSTKTVFSSCPISARDVFCAKAMNARMALLHCLFKQGTLKEFSIYNISFIQQKCKARFVHKNCISKYRTQHGHIGHIT